jgi:hypothetical protein
MTGGIVFENRQEQEKCPWKGPCSAGTMWSFAAMIELHEVSDIANSPSMKKQRQPQSVNLVWSFWLQEWQQTASSAQTIDLQNKKSSIDCTFTASIFHAEILIKPIRANSLQLSFCIAAFLPGNRVSPLRGTRHCRTHRIPDSQYDIQPDRQYNKAAQWSYNSSVVRLRHSSTLLSTVYKSSEAKLHQGYLSKFNWLRGGRGGGLNWS